MKDLNSKMMMRLTSTYVAAFCEYIINYLIKFISFWAEGLTPALTGPAKGAKYLYEPLVPWCVALFPLVAAGTTKQSRAR